MLFELLMFTVKLYLGVQMAFGKLLGGTALSKIPGGLPLQNPL